MTDKRYFIITAMTLVLVLFHFLVMEMKINRLNKLIDAQMTAIISINAVVDTMKSLMK